VQRRLATPKSLVGQAIKYSRNQWASLVRYLNDARFAINNGASERAIRPLAIGRANWLRIGGDGGLTTAAVLLSVCASATRHRLDPWLYLRDVLDQLAARSADADASDLLPDAWAIRPIRLVTKRCRGTNAFAAVDDARRAAD
jgi:transposase